MSQEGLTEAAQLVKGEAKPQAHISLEEAGILRQWRSCGGREESCPMGKVGRVWQALRSSPVHLSASLDTLQDAVAVGLGSWSLGREIFLGLSEHQVNGPGGV